MTKIIFILISLKLDDKIITFKDSLRIFPVKLNELCNIFNIKGKTNDYKIEYNSLDLFNNSQLLREFKSYAIQDSKCLYKALLIAQNEYISKYNVDITSIVSIPSLAFKIFRLNYLKVNIPILSKMNDRLIRRSYFGGATDIYNCYGENLHYYDVNSLYPLAMSKPMPLNLVQNYNSANNINLDKFFGFLEVNIECPLSVLRPVLPYRFEGKTIFPKGIFTGVYFSEELKAVLPLGYKILRIHSAKEFDKADLFTAYVNEMYHQKMNSTGSQRWISKLLLNSLYGIFGRKQEIIESVTINKSDIHKYICTNIIKSVINIDDNKCTLLIIKNIDPQLINELNINMCINIKSFETLINSNVGIASAITSYARIHMIPYKINPNTLYTDTDSIFTTEALPNDLIGKELGLMKDELSGLRIKQAYFLGIKQYGYWYLDHDNNRIQKSVWAGVSRDTLTFSEIVNLYNKNVLTKTIDSRFFKSLIKLNIIIKSIKINIRFNPHKQLVNNNYQPITINNLKYNNNLINKLIFYIKNKLLKFLN
uniref:DNA polymerase n=1 Tax=Fomes fomentarius TaxID=40442 RepID=UPI003001EEB7|nr:DNA polymerase [Fomes fomentarius]